MKPLTLLGLASLPSAIALNIPAQQILFPGELSRNSAEPSGRETCPQAPKVAVPNDGLQSSLKFLDDGAFRTRQAKRLSRAVQVPTVVGDFMEDPYDDAFEPVVQFQELLKEMFPLVYVLINNGGFSEIVTLMQAREGRDRPYQPTRSGLHL